MSRWTAYGRLNGTRGMCWLRVVSGPATGVPPVWSLRDDGVAMPGWKAARPGEDAS